MATIDVTGLSEDKVHYLEQLIEGWLQDSGSSDLGASERDGSDVDQTWNEFFQIGDTIAEQDKPGQDTLTAVVLSMRR